MDPEVLTTSGVDIVEDNVVVASGWELHASAEGMPETTARLAAAGIRLGRVLGYVPTRGSPSPREVARVPGTLVDAGDHRVVWLSHEAERATVLWYTGDSVPDALTRCLVPWEDLTVRVEAALAARDCAPVVDELWTHNWGAPTPGAPELLARCDAQWRERIAALTEASDLEEILSVKWYHMRRWIGFKAGTGYEEAQKPTLFADPINSYARLAPILQSALARTNLTPAQSVIAPLLVRAFAREPAVPGSGRFNEAFGRYLPRVTGLSDLGLEEGVLAHLHALFAPEKPSYRGGDAPWRFATGPAIWSVSNVDDQSSRALVYEGAGRGSSWVDKGKTEAHVRYDAWRERVDKLERELTEIEDREGPCRYVQNIKTEVKEDIFSTYTRITTTTHDYGDSWWCPEGPQKARKAWRAALDAEPPYPGSTFVVESYEVGRDRYSVYRSKVRFAIGSPTQRWALDEELRRHLFELSGGAQHRPLEWVLPETARPSSRCDAAGAPEALVPMLGTWTSPAYVVRICFNSGSPTVDIARLPTNFYAKTYSPATLNSDGSLQVMMAWTDAHSPSYWTFRGGGDHLTRTTGPVGNNHEPVLAPQEFERRLGPLALTDTSEDLQSDLSDGFLEREGARTLAMLSATLLNEHPVIGGLFRSDVRTHLERTLSGAELQRTLFILGYPIAGELPASVRLLDAWTRNTPAEPGVPDHDWEAWVSL